LPHITHLETVATVVETLGSYGEPGGLLPVDQKPVSLLIVDFRFPSSSSIFEFLICSSKNAPAKPN